MLKISEFFVSNLAWLVLLNIAYILYDCITKRRIMKRFKKISENHIQYNTKRPVLIFNPCNHEIDKLERLLTKSDLFDIGKQITEFSELSGKIGKSSILLYIKDPNFNRMKNLIDKVNENNIPLLVFAPKTGGSEPEFEDIEYFQYCNFPVTALTALFTTACTYPEKIGEIDLLKK
jgi:hypothetical protein